MQEGDTVNELFVAALKRLESDVLSDIPLGLLDPAEVNTLNWIWDYRKKYGQLPTLQRLDQEIRTRDVKQS